LRAADGFFDSKGVRIHYSTQGKGEPVVLIHGVTVSFPLQWVLPGIASSLAKKYKVIGIDCRGHGRSGKPHDPKAYGCEMAEDVIRLLDHLKIPKAHVVGYSMGGFIALNLLANHPDRLLSATAGAAGSGQKVETAFLEDAAAAFDRGKGMGLLLRRLNAVGYEMPTAAQIETSNRLMLLVNDPKAIAAVMRGMKGLAFPLEKLKANKVPVLALIGEFDPLKAGVDAMRGQVANLSVVVLPDADHMNAFAVPAFTQNLLDFLSKNGNGMAAGKDAKSAAVQRGAATR
jgi:pimeloyl-ACP methyl ester carboxylesterase